MPLKGKKILIVDDEEDILELLEYTFLQEGMQVFRAGNATEGLTIAREVIPDIFVLDVMMPGMDGIEMCRVLRGTEAFESSIILFLTARGEEYSEVAGFDAGADDYIVKPVKIRSLVKRMQALLRREPERPAGEFVQAGDIMIDPASYVVKKGQEEIRLPRKEFELLLLLARNKNKVMRRETILREVWGLESVIIDRTIDVHIRRVRKRVGEDLIQTIKGVGYKLVESGSAI